MACRLRRDAYQDVDDLVLLAVFGEILAQAQVERRLVGEISRRDLGVARDQETHGVRVRGGDGDVERCVALFVDRVHGYGAAQ